jgi:hypothetical protein
LRHAELSPFAELAALRIVARREDRNIGD